MYRLQNSHSVLRPMAVASVVALLASVAVVSGTGAGRSAVVTVVVLGWLAFGLSQLALTRASLETQGNLLRVRRLFGWTELSGPQVTRLVQVFTPRGPSFRLCTPGRPRGVLAPCALLHRGQSTLFEWVLTFARDAELDPRSTQTLTLLRERGLMTDPPGLSTPAPTGNPEGSS